MSSELSTEGSHVSNLPNTTGSCLPGKDGVAETKKKKSSIATQSALDTGAGGL